jgi:hypothetical protein
LAALADGGELFHQRPDQEADVRSSNARRISGIARQIASLVELAAAADVVKRGRETV